MLIEFSKDEIISAFKKIEELMSREYQADFPEHEIELIRKVLEQIAN